MAGGYPSYLEAYEERARWRWGRRLLVTTVIFLVLLIGVLAIVDRAAVGFAERTIADQVSQEVAANDVRAARPEVAIGGFPFLTQVVAGRYESISILLRNVRGSVNGDDVNLAMLDIEARGVTASIAALRSGRGEVVAETVAGTGTVSYGSVEELIDRPGVRLAERNGQLVVTAPLELLGQRFTLSGTARLAVANGVVQVRFSDLEADGLPPAASAKALVNSYAQQISIDIPLPDLPFQLDVQQVRALPGGLAVTATARNVSLRG